MARIASSGKRSDYVTVIGEGSSVEGNFSFTGAVLLNGRVRGEIVSSGTVVVGEKGVVNASIRAGFIQILGEVVGNVYASERAELCSGSRVDGDVDAPVMRIEEGAVFEGRCRMTRTRPPEAIAAPARETSLVPLKRTELPR